MMEAEIANLRARVRELTEANADLREQLAQFNALLVLADSDTNWWIFSQHYKITKHQLPLLRCLPKRQVATEEMLYTAMYAHRITSDWPDPKILEVQICKIRRALPPGSIVTLWGRGYALSEKGRKWLDNELNYYGEKRLINEAAECRSAIR